MNTERAEKEIKELLDSGLNFEYEFETIIIDKYMFAIEQSGYTMIDILSKLQPNEKLVFYMNDGMRADWIESTKKYSPVYMVEERIGSIYYIHEKYGKCIRISSDKGSVRKWAVELGKIFISTNYGN